MIAERARRAKGIRDIRAMSCAVTSCCQETSSMVE